MFSQQYRIIRRKLSDEMTPSKSGDPSQYFTFQFPSSKTFKVIRKVDRRVVKWDAKGWAWLARGCFVERYTSCLRRCCYITFL